MAKVGKLLALISSALTIAFVALMLFSPMYSYQSGDSRGAFSSGTMSALRHALATGDSAWFFWSGFIVVVCLVAAVGALAERAAPIWVCAGTLWVVAVLGMWSIGLFILPLSITLFVSAALLTAARYESRTH